MTATGSSVRQQSFVRERQAPLRKRYEREPAAALVHKRAVAAGSPADPFRGSVLAGEGPAWMYGIDQAVGGYHDAPNPAEMLCAALAACEHSTIALVANLLGVRVERLTVEVSGDVDVRGCLAMDQDVAVGFRSMCCRVDLRTAPGTPGPQLEALRTAAHRFCINLDTLRHGVDVEVSMAP